MENWKPVIGYRGHYEVSDLGRVRSIARTVQTTSTRGLPYTKAWPARILRHVDQRGYQGVRLSLDGVVQPLTVHRIVLETFVGPRPASHQINHLNGNKADNRLVNLEYCTLSQNLRHRHRVLGRVSKRPPFSVSTRQKMSEKQREIWARRRLAAH